MGPDMMLGNTLSIMPEGMGPMGGMPPMNMSMPP